MKKLNRNNLPAAPGTAPSPASEGDGLPRYVAVMGRDGLAFKGGQNDSRVEFSALDILPVSVRWTWRGEASGRVTQSQDFEVVKAASTSPRMAVQVLCFREDEDALGDGGVELCVVHANGYAAADLGAMVRGVDEGDAPARYVQWVNIYGAREAKAVGAGSYYPIEYTKGPEATDDHVRRIVKELQTGKPDIWSREWNATRTWRKSS